MMFSERGQESAPFELLIAIIVMTFVIVVGFNALDTLNKKTCEGNINQNLEQIKSSIESVVKNKSKVNVAYELPGCYNDSESNLKIIERNDLSYCSVICGGSLAQCTVLQFSTPGYTETKCLRISSGTTFPSGAPCDVDVLEPRDGYEVINWKDSSEGIIPGQYTLMRQSNLFTDAPKICVYRRK